MCFTFYKMIQARSLCMQIYLWGSSVSKSRFLKKLYYVWLLIKFKNFLQFSVIIYCAF